jgi:hypothetical protein
MAVGGGQQTVKVESQSLETLGGGCWHLGGIDNATGSFIFLNLYMYGPLTGCRLCVSAGRLAGRPEEREATLPCTYLSVLQAKRCNRFLHTSLQPCVLLTRDRAARLPIIEPRLADSLEKGILH